MKQWRWSHRARSEMPQNTDARPIGSGPFGSHLGDGYGAGPDISLITADTGDGEGTGPLGARAPMEISEIQLETDDRGSQ